MQNSELEKMLKDFLDRLDSVDGTLEDFSKTLNNHMNDYHDRLSLVRKDFVKLKQTISERVHNLNKMFNWGFGVVIALQVVILGTLGAVAVMLLDKLLTMISEGAI